MFIDKQGKLFGKFSVIDLGLILVILAAALFIGVKFIGNDSAKQQQSECTYVVKIANIKDSSKEYLRAGEKLFDDKGAYMGEIINNPEFKPTEALNVNDDGEFIKAEIPGRTDAYVTIKGEGIKNDNGFYLDGKVSLLIGTDRFFKADDIDFHGTVMEIFD